MKRQKNQVHFVVCLNNEGYKASLEVGKLYRVIPNEEAETHGYIRVIDESGEDYAFASDRFHPVKLPVAVEKTLLAVRKEDMRIETPNPASGIQNSNNKNRGVEILQSYFHRRDAKNAKNLLFLFFAESAKNKKTYPAGNRLILLCALCVSAVKSFLCRCPVY